MFGVTSDGTRHPAAPVALAATSVPSHISARPISAFTSAPEVPDSRITQHLAYYRPLEGGRYAPSCVIQGVGVLSRLRALPTQKDHPDQRALHPWG